ncbi:hypothetical protein Q2T83_14960 [Fervidibacter sacchari]|uniref:Glycoside hydrolase family 42 N-terminal domain-containing protein n=1 Tax=Candidatus Fervidibacter sacchari TaxID=1448929 RepID=A0ABT2EJD5_9BACT|nr:hypothetical protein [Candidatus Fervidibacter sacchari]MCS3917799.1 hypothetical protein [Candidatus Fervidibacter sacchari]WKU15621.1 hypothetical protein Q2T83_14960 [Candidatus Fervidibacter sacchari]
MRKAIVGLFASLILFMDFKPKAVSQPNSNLVRNGSFERVRVGWVFSGDAEIAQQSDAPHRQKVLRCSRNGDMARQVIIAEPSTQYAVSLWVRTKDVKPISGSGYAYAAIYEFDFHGNLVAFRDCVQLSGTQGWRRFDATWETHQRTFYFEVRLGLYNAEGIAQFDAVQVVQGNKTPQRYEEAPTAKGGVALILHEPNFPQNPASPSPEKLAHWLSLADYKPQIVSAEQLADSTWIEANRSRIGLLVLPNSPYFPLEAHRNLLRLLVGGVDLLTFGGYAFDVPMAKMPAGYKPIRYGQPISATLLNVNPDFETVATDGSVEGWEVSNPQQCFISDWVAKSRKRSAGVSVTGEAGSAIWKTSVSVQAGERLRVSGWVKTEGVKGTGYAFLAYYPFAGDKWVKPRDIAQVRGTSDWQHFVADFVVPYGVDRVEVRFGIYNASGTAFFDDVRVERIELPPCLNTRYGNPQDGLETSPLQLGIFDAHYPLRNAVRLEAKGWVWETKGTQISGYSAVGVLHASALWKPIIFALDRFGRICGTAGAVMHHYAGVFAGGNWVFFGVDNFDLTALPKFNESVLLPLLKHLRRSVFMHGQKSKFACYRPHEPIEATVNVSNFGGSEFIGQVVFALSELEDGSMTKGQKFAEKLTTSFKAPVKVGSGEIVAVNARWTDLNLREGLYRITARLLDANGSLVDEMESGFVVWDGQTFTKRLNFRYSDNYFWLNGSPTFLLGTDTWANWFHSPSQSDPLFWRQQICMMRDAGLTVFENLQWTPPNYRFSEVDWRKLDAMIWLSHRIGIVYMAGLLIGHDVAVDDETLERQAKFITEFAERYRNADGLIYYLNGDYQLRPKTPEQTDLRWQIQQTLRWNERLVAAIKSADPNHPVTSEYYQVPVGGINLRLTIDGLNISNIGYFDEPTKDLRRFAAVFKLTDMRLYGKSLNIGEFGVKTHPAWERELGASGYHIRRTEEEQWQLMLLLPQLAFGLGASKVQNWCWRDDDDRVFPWGLIYPCDNVPKPALKAYRASALILRSLKPVWRKPEVLLVVPDSNRMLPDGAKVWHAALVAAQTLASLRVDFAVASDLKLSDDSLKSVKAVFLPGVIGDIPTETEVALRQFVERGGVIYRSGVSGEVAMEWDIPDVSEVDEALRERYRQILEKAKVATIRTEPDLPTIHAFRIPLQNGTAFVFVNASDEPVTFTAFLPNASYAHRASQVTHYELRITPHAFRITMTLGTWQPGMVAFDEQGRIFLVEGSGQILLDGELVAEGNGHFAAFADSDLREAKQIWLLPTEAITVILRRAKNAPKLKIAEVGEWRGGEWFVLERASLSCHDDAIAVKISDDLKGEVIQVK